MPNGKTHFIAGAVVGATVNVLVQSTEMAMDYDKPFNWGEFFLCTGAGAFAANPKPMFSPSHIFWHPSPSVFFRGPLSSFSVSSVSSCSFFPTARQFFHTILAATLIAWALSGKHTLKLSRATRLALWVFGMSYLSHIALDCTTPK